MYFCRLSSSSSGDLQRRLSVVWRDSGFQRLGITDQFSTCKKAVWIHLLAAASDPSLPWFCCFPGGTRDESTPCALVCLSSECTAAELDW